MAKRRSTKAERDYMGRVAELGCVVCQMPANVHHKTGGTGMGQRAGNYDTFPLCGRHHQHGGHGIALHAGIKTWEESYGTESYHVAETQRALGYVG